MTPTNEQPSFSPPPFDPPFWLSNPHLQTILPKFFAPDVPKYRRDIVKDSLNESDVAYDFYDAHLPATNSSDHIDSTPLIVLFHGMEGDSASHYARALAHHVHAQGWHFVVAHFRSCGGIPVSGDVYYNAGDTDEIHHTLHTLQQQFANVYAVGVSLGGNALAKYLGEYGDDALCQAAVVISAPVDMSSAAYAMQSFVSQRIYTPYLLNPMIKKAVANDLSPEEIDSIKDLKSISEFDSLFTAPRHGYRSNIDYYHRSSALPYLLHVTRPLLLISAKDDPFIGFTASKNDVSDRVTLLDTEHGGHVGFLRYNANVSKSEGSKFDINWIPETVSDYFYHVGITASP